MLAHLVCLMLPLGLGSAPLDRAVPPPPRAPSLQSALEPLREALAEEGMRIDLERGIVSVPVTVLVRDELLEYLLVGPRGATHESLFLTEVTPSLLNAALLALGVEPGANARWEEMTEEVRLDERGVRRPPELEVILPEGEGFLLYAAWREGDETFFYRVDDLLANLDTGRSMRRHRWVFLGSRFDRPSEDEPELFVADLAGNLINVSFFYRGDTLVTAALPECERQTIWVANSWLLPSRDTPVELFLARGPLEACPPEWEDELPRVPPSPGPGGAEDEAGDDGDDGDGAR